MSTEGFELTAVEYARLHGLSVDHLAEPLPTSHIVALREHLPDGLSDDANLAQLDLPLYGITQESLALDKRGAEHLRAASNGLTLPEELESITRPLLDIRKTKKLRLETPLLRTDPESDLRSFANEENSHFRVGNLPWEPLDDETDAGLGWPTRLYELPATVLRELEVEKIEVHRQTLIYLQSIVKGGWTAKENREMWENATSYKRNTALEPVTPPLLPLSPPSKPYIPSSPDCHLPLLSDPPSLISEDLRNAEQAIFQHDTLIHPGEQSSSSPNSSNTMSSCHHIKPPDTILQLDFLEESERFPAPVHTKAEDHKVEVPLMPLMPAPSFPKIVRFNDVVEEMLLDRSSPSLGSDKGCGFFREAFGDAAAAADRSIEQEQLQEPDVKHRVEVPVMDFRLPDPPWRLIHARDSSANVMDFQKQLVADIRCDCGFPPPYSDLRKLNLKLRWTVFQSDLAKVVLDEPFGDDEVLHDALTNGIKQPVVDSSDLIWKPSGFRILKEDTDDCEDDLGPGEFEVDQNQDISSLVRKRKRQFEEETSDSKISANVTTATNYLANSSFLMSDNILHGGKVQNKIGPNLLGDLSMIKEKPVHDRGEMNPLLDGHFSASNALDNFLEIRVSRKQKPSHSAYFSGPSRQGQGSKLVLTDQLDQSTVCPQELSTQDPLPVPSAPPLSAPTPYIISSAILKRRPLIKAINALFPTGISIERDFTVHNRTVWIPGSVTRSPVMSSLDSEADFIISPSTGIILTTLQKIKQKPLPGQKTKSAFKERIEKVSARYERLIVLASEASPDESTNGLDENDALALAEAIGFCGLLGGSVTLYLIGGGEETLARWLVATMAQHGSQGESRVPLLEDETLWELFLRRAGMNAYAAQAVINELKAPDGVDVEGGSKAGLFGISAFVEMGQEDRILRFEQLLGGRRILERVGRVIDADWS